MSVCCAAGVGAALRFTFERLISIDLVLYGGALILEFVALVVLRVPGTGAREAVSCSGWYSDCQLDRAGSSRADRLCFVGGPRGAGGRSSGTWVRGAGGSRGSGGVSGGAAGYPLPPYLVVQSIQ